MGERADAGDPALPHRTPAALDRRERRRARHGPLLHLHRAAEADHLGELSPDARRYAAQADATLHEALRQRSFWLLTAATLADRHRARALCTKLNQAGLAIAGQLDQLTIGALHGGQFVDQCAVRLGPG